MRINISMMHDHYAVIADGYVVGTIERAIGPGNQDKWGLHMLGGSRPDVSYVLLHHAMGEALKWRPD